MKERLFVIASQRSIGKTRWIVGEKAGPRSRKYVKTWSFRTRAEAMHLIETLGRLVEDLGRLPWLTLHRGESETLYMAKHHNRLLPCANFMYLSIKRRPPAGGSCGRLPAVAVLGPPLPRHIDARP